MTQRFEERIWRSELELADDEELAAVYDLGGSRRAALVRLPDTNDDYECGAELGSGGECTREVDEPDGRCWQHE